jgi:hypothetical protein
MSGKDFIAGISAPANRLAAWSGELCTVCGNREFVGRLTTNRGPIDGFRPANTGLEG